MRLVDPAADDLVPLAVLHAACFDTPWDAASLAASLAVPGTFAFAVADGFVMARVTADEGEILTLAVAPAARGNGQGRALMREALAHAARQGATVMFLEVGQDNRAALAVYASLGFARAGQRKGYYDGRDAWMMKLELPLSPGPEFA